MLSQKMAHISSLSTITSSELSSFVKSKIEPDTAYIQRCNAVVDRLCQFMINSLPPTLRPSEVRKCGSLGKGTAVIGKSDADLVVFLAEFHSISTLRSEIKRILDEMQEYFVKFGGCKLEGKTWHAVKLLITCNDHTHSVDILPSVDILKLKTTKDIFKEMESLSDCEKGYYSAALAPLQVEFVARAPTKVKTLSKLQELKQHLRRQNYPVELINDGINRAMDIPLAQLRRTRLKEEKQDEKIPFENTSDQRLPSSYSLELIVIAVWETAGKPENFELCKGFYHVLRAIAYYRCLKHAWTLNYDSHYVQRDPFYVVDPANPFNNVLTACNCWDMIAAKAKSLLQARLFEECVDGQCGWQ
ncbi:2'-5'-oligoadenylate synthase 3-like [Crassostrea angulata]|uniref:2'-5'-oligoadenylate synthase 3-like n=1 Tax=Magallana angulata TaxID=2784310 RepID=UPI0022B0ECB8|nr:2'-5'-oligoadenylate synthase 3-like [Crassostrea angulata]